MCIVAGNDGKHQSTDQEALNLNPATTKYLDKDDGQEVSRHVSRSSDDKITVSVLEESVVFGFAFGEADGRQEDGLVEVETVEGDVDKEPAGCRTNELLQVSPFAEIDHEGLHLHVLGRWSDVCFDDGCVPIRGG